MIPWLARFFGAYLTGVADELTCLVPPAARINAAASRFERLSSLSPAEPISAVRVRDTRLVLVTVKGRGLRSRVVYPLRSRFRLVRRDRWYVVRLDGIGERRR